MRVFCKTCPRDAARVGYQIEAVKARGWEHRLLVDKLDDYQAILDGTWGDGVDAMYAAEQCMPEALEVEHPYMRQQVCKILAPRLWGDMLQVDSDMCPATSATFAELVVRGRWFYRPAEGSRRDAVREWGEAYEVLTGESVGRAEGLDFMGPMKGWWITHELVAAFLDDIDGVEALVAFANEAGRGKHKFSEYQLLGTYAYLHGADHLFHSYDFIEGQQPFWCHHFTSAEPLTQRQRVILERAGHVDT